MLSIVTVVLNDREGLLRTSDSLSGQINSSFEWVIYDGDSQHECKSLVLDLIRTGRAVGTSKSDNGLYDAMNKAMEYVTQPYVLFLNAGDRLAAPNTIALIESLLKSTHFDSVRSVVLGQYFLVNEAGRRHLRTFRPGKDLPHTMPTCHQAMIFQSAAVLSHPYPTNYLIKGDFFLYCSLIAAGYQQYRCDFPICEFQLGGLSYKNPVKALKEHWDLQRDVLACKLPTRIRSFLRLSLSIFGRRILRFLR